MLPGSSLLKQKDVLTFNELVQFSTLLNFRSNITILQEGEEENRVSIPVSNDEAHVTFYLIYKKAMKNIFHISSKDIQDIPWKDI